MVWIPDDVWYAATKKWEKGNSKGGSGGGGGNSQMIMGFLKALANQGGAGAGGAGSRSGGGKKKAQSFSGDFKGELIAKIKEFQRSGEENKKAWWDFCDSQGGGNRDPARHDDSVLQGFLASYGIQVTQGDSFVKGELVNKIKAFQRSSEENKQAWWDFADSHESGKRDPALYDPDVLQNFLAEHGIQGVQGSAAQKAALVAKIKNFQKSGESQKQTWWAYCDTHGGKKRDPKLHEINFLEAFILENGI